MHSSDLDLGIGVIAVSAHLMHFSLKIRRFLEVWRVRGALGMSAAVGKTSGASL